MQEAWYESYLFRLAGSVVVGLLLLLIRQVRHLLLRLLNRLMPVTRVAGAWETEIDRGNGTRDRHETANLTQLGPWLWGEARRRDGTGRYKLRGHVSNDKVCLTYRANPPALDVGAALMKLDLGGQHMEGLEIGCDLDDGKVMTLRYFWTRQP